MMIFFDFVSMFVCKFVCLFVWFSLGLFVCHCHLLSFLTDCIFCGMFLCSSLSTRLPTFFVCLFFLVFNVFLCL